MIFSALWVIFAFLDSAFDRIRSQDPRTQLTGFATHLIGVEKKRNEGRVSEKKCQRIRFMKISVPDPIHFGTKPDPLDPYPLDLRIRFRIRL
jgi:hypothetical protein